MPVPLDRPRLASTADDNRIEAPVTWKAYLICAFASFGGIYFGYDSGYINGVLGSTVFINQVDPGMKAVTASHNSLIVSILSCGTFFGAIIAGDVADIIGRKWTVITGCCIYGFGVLIQMFTGVGGSALGVIVAGRLIAGLGVGFESAVVILYMSEIVRIFPSPPTGSAGARTLTFTIVPQKSSRRVGRWIPILYHHWFTSRILCHIRGQQTHDQGLLPHPHRSAVYLGRHSGNGLALLARLATLLREAWKTRCCHCLTRPTPWSASRIRVRAG